MVGSEVEDASILRNFHEVMLKATTMPDDTGTSSNQQSFNPEYACLRSMMLEPQNPTMWNSLALVYMMTGQVTDALEAIERSLDFDTGNAWTWSIWGDILYQIDDFVQSERAYRMAFELGARESHILFRLMQRCRLRGNMLDALGMLEILLPLYPDNQELWDQYTAVFTSTKL